MAIQPPPQRDSIGRAVLLVRTAGAVAVRRAFGFERPNTGTQYAAKLVNLMARASVKSGAVAIRISLGIIGGRLRRPDHD